MLELTKKEYIVEELFIQYGPTLGYIILLLGSFVEGETFVLTAGFLAYTGFFSLPMIIAISFCGSVVADQILYFVGRAHGPRLLKKYPKAQERAQKAFRLLHKHNLFFILGFRFVYGIRTVSPFVIGASGIAVRRFAVLNLIAGAIWAVVSCYVGYGIGYFFADALDDAKARYQSILWGIFIAAVAIGVTVWWRYYRRNRSQSKNS